MCMYSTPLILERALVTSINLLCPGHKVGAKMLSNCLRSSLTCHLPSRQASLRVNPLTWMSLDGIYYIRCPTYLRAPWLWLAIQVDYISLPHTIPEVLIVESIWNAYVYIRPPTWLCRDFSVEWTRNATSHPPSHPIIGGLPCVWTYLKKQNGAKRFKTNKS